MSNQNRGERVRRERERGGGVGGGREGESVILCTRAIDQWLTHCLAESSTNSRYGEINLPTNIDDLTDKTKLKLQMCTYYIIIILCIRRTWRGM